MGKFFFHRWPLCVLREWEEEKKRRRRESKEREWKLESKGNEERILSFHLFIKFSSFPQTPLHQAAIYGSVECVNALLQNGADMAAKDVRSESVCESASHRR